MSDTTPLTEAEAAEALAAAEQEAAAADASVTDLERRVMAGDDDVTAEQIETQKGLARFARLRIDAARTRVRVARQARVRAEVDDAIAQVREFGDFLVDLEPLERAAVEAFAELAQAWRRQQAEGRRVGDQLDTAAAKAEAAGVPGPLEVARMRGNARGINAPEVRWQPSDRTAFNLVSSIVGPSGLAIVTGDSVVDNGVPQQLPSSIPTVERDVVDARDVAPVQLGGRLRDAAAGDAA